MTFPRLAAIRSKTFSATVAATLDDAVRDWIQENAGEKTLVDAKLSSDGATYWLVLIYAE